MAKASVGCLKNELLNWYHDWLFQWSWRIFVWAYDFKCYHQAFITLVTAARV